MAWNNYTALRNNTAFIIDEYKLFEWWISSSFDSGCVLFMTKMYDILRNICVFFEVCISYIDVHVSSAYRLL